MSNYFITLFKTISISDFFLNLFFVYSKYNCVNIDHKFNASRNTSS